MDPLLATLAQNGIIANSVLTYTTGPLTFLFHLIFHTTTEHYLRFSCIHLQTLASNPDFHFTNLNHVDYPHSLSSRSSHLHRVIPEANLLVDLRKSFPLLSQTLGDSIQILDVIIPSH